MKYKMMFRASKEGKGLSKLTFLHIETCIWHMTFKACFHVPISIGVHFFPCSFIYNTLWLLTIYGCTRQDINHGFGHWGNGAHSSQLKRSCNHLSLITLTPSAHTHVGVFTTGPLSLIWRHLFCTALSKFNLSSQVCAQWNGRGWGASDSLDNNSQTSTPESLTGYGACYAQVNKSPLWPFWAKIHFCIW